MSKVRYTLKKAIISDKIYFYEEDLVDIDIHTLKYVLFNYNLGDTFFSTIQYDETTKLYSVPSGSWHKLNILNLVDNRFTGIASEWRFNGALREAQQEVVDTIYKNGKLYSGLIQAPCGFGKSFVGGYLIANYAKPTIVICHTKLLADQWYTLLSECIDGAEIGYVGDGRERIRPITVAIYKSLISRMDKIQDKFEVAIVDESHLCPANTFSAVVNGINCRIKLALTATPWRKDGLHVILSDYFGPNRVIAKDTNKLIPAVEIVKTTIPFTIRDPNRDWTKQLTKIATNVSYINLIAEKVNDKVAHGRCVLILSERIDMLKSLQEKIPKSILLVGATKNRDEILEGAGTKYDVILTTKIFDEGISCHRLDTLVLTCPNNNQAKLEQRIGRIQRDHPEKKTPLLMDFWLVGPIVQAQQKNRLEWYIRKNFPILNE